MEMMQGMHGEFAGGGDNSMESFRKSVLTITHVVV